MDLGCKLSWGVSSRKSRLPAPFSHRGVCTEIFLRFYFCLRGTGRGGGRAAAGWGLGLSTLHSTNAVSVFSLSLFRARTPVPTRHPGPSHARGPAEDDRPLRPCPLRRGHPHAARRPLLAAHLPTSPETLVAQPSGASVLGARGAAETVSCPRLPPQKRHRHTRPPADPRCHPNRRLRRPSRDRTGRAASSAVVLSCLVSPPPATPVFVLVFFPPPLPLPPPAPSSLGSAQVNGSPPRLHGSPAHVTFPSRFFLCVYLSYFPSFLPFLFPSLPLLPCNWRLCNEFANSWTVRLLFFQMFLLCLPPFLSPFLSFILPLDH